jgi:hypothetical protein
MPHFRTNVGSFVPDGFATWFAHRNGRPPDFVVAAPPLAFENRSPIGRRRSEGVMPIRKSCLVVLTAFALMGCGNNNGDDDPVANTGPSAAASWGESEPSQEQGNGGQPAPEGEGPEKPAPEQKKPYANLPQLPVGGDGTTVDVLQEPHCVTVNMLQGVSEGVQVKVTGVGLTRTEIFERGQGSCPTKTCQNFTFSSDSGACSVAVVAHSYADNDSGDPDGYLVMSGDVRCDRGAEQACTEWVRQAKSQDGAIGLFGPVKDDSTDPDTGGNDPDADPDPQDPPPNPEATSGESPSPDE